MSHPTALGIHTLGEWLWLLAGTATILALGTVWSRRWFGVRGPWLAPVTGVAVLSMTAMALDLLFEVPVRDWITWVLALVLIVAARPWQFAWARPRAWPIVLVALLAMFVHSLPHLAEGETGPAGLTDVPGQVLDGMQGGEHPHPVHVDEYVHMARAAAVDRQETVFFDDPYTGDPVATDQFTLQGTVHERGFWVALAQLQHLTDLPWATLFRFLPAVWAGTLAAGAVSLIPGRHSWAAGVGVAALPTSVLFLGPGFLVAISFGLPWILLALAAARERRLAALFVIITSAFTIHLVIGGICMLAAAALPLSSGPWRDRLGGAASALLPLLWVGPAIQAEVRAEFTNQIGHPWNYEILLAAGPVFMALALLGAWSRTPLERAATIVMAACIASIAWATWTETNSLAAYYRLIHPLILAGALLLPAGLQRLEALVPRSAVPTAAIGLLFVLVAHADQNYYRMFDDDTWEAANEIPGDSRFLSHPWHAPWYHTVSGATPHAVLYPGSEPTNQHDWDTYLVNQGDPAWFDSRGITVVIAGVAPNAPHVEIAPYVYDLEAAANQGTQ